MEPMMPTDEQIQLIHDRLKIVNIAAQAALRPGTPFTWRAQMRAIAGLAALQLHHTVGQADFTDADKYNADLLAIANVADRLVEAIGQEVKSEFSASIDMSLFKGQLDAALQGNATYEIEQAGRDAYEDEQECQSDARGWEKARQLGVD